jgi:hypothetical protein
VVATSRGPAAVYGECSVVSGPGGVGVHGVNNSGGIGVFGQASVGVRGESSFLAVHGASTTGLGVTGSSTRGVGVVGSSQSNIGIYGSSQSNTGVLGESTGEYGVRGLGGNIGVYAYNKTVGGNAAYLGTRGLAADFFGEVYVHGHLTKAGGGFTIDHPLDPAHRYLHHSFVESPERKNVYDGIAVLDGAGEAVIELPEWFGAVNRDCRYQLTCVGGYAPVYVAQKLEDNRFRIAGGSPGLEVSWQVTGVRRDPWAMAHPLAAETEKPEAERGSFLHPELYGQPEDRSVERARYPHERPQSPDLSEFLR